MPRPAHAARLPLLIAATAVTLAASGWRAEAATAKVIEPKPGPFGTVLNTKSAANCQGSWNTGDAYYGLVLDYKGSITRPVTWRWLDGTVCTFTPRSGSGHEIDDGAAWTADGKLFCEYTPNGWRFPARGELTIYGTQWAWGFQAVLDVKGTGAYEGCKLIQNLGGVFLPDP